MKAKNHRFVKKSCLVSNFCKWLWCLKSKDITQTQQISELPTVILTWQVCKYKVQKLHQRFILIELILNCNKQLQTVCTAAGICKYIYLYINIWEPAGNLHAANS